MTYTISDAGSPLGATKKRSARLAFVAVHALRRGGATDVTIRDSRGRIVTIEELQARIGEDD